ncbi:MAG: DUF4382 domain-containing protein [Cyclobacteriaceae bacterium]
MIRNHKYNFLVFIFSFLLGFTACDSEPGMARLVVKLTDAPADYQEVNVDIQNIEVNVNQNGDESGWTTLENTNTGVFNLLELTNGISAVLADVEIPAGYISQIRLQLGDNNTLKMGDQMIDLKTPSAQQSGLKIKLNSTLSANITYEILLDFDAARSVVKAGNSGNFNLKPVIRASAEAQDGAIKGMITPSEASSVVYAIQGADTVTSTFTNDVGRFLIRGLADGTYTVSISPQDPYQTETRDEVLVNIGNVTDLGTIALTD